MRRPLTTLLALGAGTVLGVAAWGPGDPEAASAGPERAGASARASLRAPARLREVRSATDRVAIAWRNHSRGHTSQRVIWSRAGSGRSQARRMGPRARQLTIRGLAPGTRYRIVVRACRARRCGPGAVLGVRTGRGRPAGSPRLAGCAVFPSDSPWNRRVDDLPRHPDSDTLVASIGLDDNLHPDFGSGRSGDFGIPITVAPADQPRVPIEFTDFGDESDPGPYPIPPDARVEGARDRDDGDRHVLVVQRGSCMLYELFDARRRGNGWAAASGAVFDLSSNRLRPAGFTSADAAGLPIAPGLARVDEVGAGAIRHALRFTARRTRRAYIHPARHFASSDDDPSLPPMGLRVRLRRSFDISGYTGQARVILEALRDYGMLLADNGSDWFVSGTPDPGWNDDELDQLKRVPGSAFEAVDTGPARTG